MQARLPQAVLTKPSLPKSRSTEAKREGGLKEDFETVFY